MKWFFWTVREIEHHDVVTSGSFTTELRDNGPWEWMKDGSKNLDEATESYMIVVIAETSNLEAATNFLYDINLSATMARQRGWVQQEQSDMCLALNMSKMAEGRLLRTAIEEMEYVIKQPWAEVREEKKWGVEFPVHKMVKAVIKRHLAMVYKNHTAGCLPCPNGTAKYRQTPWRRKGTGAPPPEPAVPPPRGLPPSGTPPAPPAHTNEYESYEIEGMPSRCVYIYSPLPKTQFFNHNAYAKDSKCNKDFIPELLSTLSAVWKYRWNWFWR